jgi:hypothetical protein
MNKALKILLGIVFILAGLVSLYFWYGDLWTVFKGCVGLIAIMAGLVCFML